MICEAPPLDLMTALVRAIQSDNPTVVSAADALIVAVALAEGPVKRPDMYDLLGHYGYDEQDMNAAILITLLGSNRHRRAALENFLDVFKSGKH